MQKQIGDISSRRLQEYCNAQLTHLRLLEVGANDEGLQLIKGERRALVALKRRFGL